MALHQNSAEGQASTTVLTAANSGGSSGTAFDSVNPVGAPTCTFDNAQSMHGTQSYHLVITTTTDLYDLRWSTSISTNGIAVRFYIRFNALPSVAIDLVTIRNSSISASKWQLTAANKLFAADASGGGNTFATVLSTGVWYRCESEVTVGTTTANGTVHAAYYIGDSLTVQDTAWAPGATRNTGTTPITSVRFGKQTASGTIACWYDDVAIDDTTTTPLGPYNTSSNIGVTDSGTGVDVLSVLNQTTISRVGSPSYASGATGAINPANPQSPTAGNLLTLCVAAIGPVGTGTAPTCTTPSGWTAGPTNSLTSTATTSHKLFWFYKTAVGADAAPSVTLGPASSNAEVMMEEWTGPFLTTPHDADSAGISGQSGATSIGDAITSSTTADWILEGFINGSSSIVLAWQSPAYVDTAPTGTPSIATSTTLASTTGSYAPSVNITSTGSGAYVLKGMAFKYLASTILPTMTDTATGVDGISVSTGTPIALTESGTATETFSQVGGPTIVSLSETITGTDVLTVPTETIALTESGAGLDKVGPAQSAGGFVGGVVNEVSVNTTTRTVALPAASVAGGYGLAMLATAGATCSFTATGWTQVVAATANFVYVVGLIKQLDSTDISTGSVTFATSNQNDPIWVLTYDQTYTSIDPSVSLPLTSSFYGTRGGVSQTFVDAPSVTPTNQAEALIIGVERTLATGTTLTSMTFGTIDYDVEANVTTNASLSAGRALLPAATASGSNRLTYTDNSGNALAFMLPMTLASVITLTDTGTGSDAVTVNTQVPLPETGTGTDALGLTAQVGLTETGTGTDALTVTVRTAVSDTATGTDSVGSQVGLTLTDTLIGTEALTVVSQVGLSDTASATDALALTTRVPVTDSGVLSDTLTFTVPLPLTDTGTGTDSLASTITDPLSDTGSASDALTVRVLVPLTETGTETDGILIGGSAVVLTDLWAGTDALSVPVETLLITETAGLTDTLGVTDVLVLAEVATATDTLAVLVLTPLVETGAGVDGLTTVVRVPLIEVVTLTDQLSLLTYVGLVDTATATETNAITVKLTVIDAMTGTELFSFALPDALNDDGQFVDHLMISYPFVGWGIPIG